ncbi:uncharacterized protein KGF55_001991 [Candida pseudojiufengensis]|uniref:uncharacterized protein n=1 Tax=Candida pseudojiufengensis TaxID=497109 RepID=UPI0022256313|nr:uncharacterized protein KGF55_001991 [Candida pseudojiufengensis]KAI5964049.1 hypothetical protein KGF55_001991 [Candida pseudojiufengensis]
MSNTTRSRRVIPSTLNSPTTVRVNQVTDILQDQAESFLTEFIDASEYNNNPLNVTNQNQSKGFSNNSETFAILSQLKRIQRSLRGLPPLAENTTNDDTTPVNKDDDIDNEKTV